MRLFTVILFVLATILCFLATDALAGNACSPACALPPACGPATATYAIPPLVVQQGKLSAHYSTRSVTRSATVQRGVTVAAKAPSACGAVDGRELALGRRHKEKAIEKSREGLRHRYIERKAQREKTV